jgi:AraC-like DNA-binding protein
MRLTGDDMFALHAAERVPFGAYRLLDYLLAASSTPGDALTRSSRCFGYMNNTFHLSLKWRRDVAYLELHNPSDPKFMPRSYIEYIFINYLVRLRMVTRAPWKPVEMYVTYEVPKSTAEYERLLGARIRFRQAVNRMVLPRSFMEICHPFADRELCELLEDHARQKMKDPAFGEDFLAGIYRALAANMKTGEVSLVSISRQMGKSCRSLQREIQSYGLSFREMLDRVRQERAFFLLCKKGLSIHEVAWELRFSDASSFCHAFRRWTGKSPEQFREEMN